MIIYHDTSYVKPSNAKWIAKGYAMEDIYLCACSFYIRKRSRKKTEWLMRPESGIPFSSGRPPNTETRFMV